MSNSHPLINGVYHSAAEVELVLFGYGGTPFRTSDISEFNFEEKLEPADVQALGGKKRGTTEGVYTATGSITLHLGAQVEFMNKLAALAKAKKVVLGAVQFSVVGSFRATAAAPLVKFQAMGARVTGRTLEGGGDAAATVVPLPLNITSLRINGLSLGEIPK